MEGFIEELRFKLSPDGGIGFELAEKTRTSKGKKAETSRAEWVVWGAAGRKCTELLVDAVLFRSSHFIL